LKILIVDDNGDDRRYLKASLEAHACDIAEAKDGQEGLELAKSLRPVLIISDALMPNMDGFQFLRAVKTDPALKHIPFIFYSSVYTGYKEEALAKSLGAEAFIVKPRDPEEFWNDLMLIIEDCGMRGSGPGAVNLISEEEDFLRMYSHVVARKLEEKVRELDGACVELRQKGYDAELLARQWQSTFDSIKDAVWIADLNGKILQLNKGAVELLGKREDEILGSTCREIVHGNGGPISDCPLERVRQTGQRESLELNIDGRQLNITADPVFDQAGSVVRVVHTISDISERVRAEEVRKTLEAQLQQSQKMEAVGRLAGGIAHDFNNILAAIVGYTELTMMHLDASSPVIRNLECILEGSEKAATMIRSLLAFSRTQALEMKPENLNELVVVVQKFLVRIIREDIRITTRLSDNNLHVMADRGQIDQILLNLVANARDAMPEGGRIVISTSRVDLDEEFVRHYGFGRPGAFALISVADTGIGMDEALTKRIFEPFFSTKDMGKGTGLGLSIVYGIVNQHNGFIDVYSESGQGSEFRIYLPLIESIAESSERPVPSYSVGGSETILVAEDNETVRRLLVNILSSFGYKVIEASDGEEAVEKFIQNKDRIDLCFLDMIMPKVGGKEAFDEIKKIRPDAKRLFTSGYNAEMLNRKGLCDNDQDFVIKPFNISNLLRKVRNTLDR
jgi:two-component system, cell cycle sensor histidine kinase and response regulator CckA